MADPWTPEWKGIETPGWEIPMPEGVRIEPFAETDAVGPDEVLTLWRREGVVPEPEAQRRVHEVLMVGLDDSDAVAGVCTVYLQRNPQLRMDLWYARVFVGREHRAGKLSFLLTVAAREWLERRFTSGQDTRGGGMLFEVENQVLKTWYPEAFWPPTEFTFIGENERGDHVRVHYFPGAVAPALPA